MSGQSVQCVECDLADLKGARGMAHHGFTNCKRKGDHRFESLTLPHPCRDFRAAPAERVAQRRDWMEREGLAA